MWLTKKGVQDGVRTGKCGNSLIETLLADSLGEETSKGQEKVAADSQEPLKTMW